VGLDPHLLSLAVAKGATTIHERVDHVGWDDGRPQLRTKSGATRTYDFLAVTVGVNTAILRTFQESNLGYKPPRTMRTYVREFCLGQETIEKHLGSSVHVFLLNLPGLEFAALIPKGNCVTMCMIGDGVDKQLIHTLMNTSEVRQCFPPDFPLDEESCRCSPLISVSGAVQPYGDRLVFIGDCGVTRFYKDGIGSAYRMAKTAASTAIFQGISAQDFEQHYWPHCRSYIVDNRIAGLIFGIVHQIQKRRFGRVAIRNMLAKEQQRAGGRRRFSTMMWDMYTGSSPYREILLRALHPDFWVRLIWNCALALVTGG
jgi:hypothetical protein